MTANSEEEASRLERAAWSNKTLEVLQASLFGLALYATAFAIAAAFFPSIRGWVVLVEGLSIGALLIVFSLYRVWVAGERKR